MTVWRDDQAEATVISQLMILGITAGIVFVAASYAFFAVDAAITEADHAGAQQSLRGTMNRLEGLAQQGVGASSVIPLPYQGALTFSGFSPHGASQDRILVMGTSAGIWFDGLEDGDDTFDVCNADGFDVTVTWHWNAHDWSGGSENPTADCGGTVAGHPLDGIVSIQVHEDVGGEDVLRAVAVLADQHLISVEAGDEEAFLVGNAVLNGPELVTSHLQARLTDVLALRFWALTGPSFSSSDPGSQLHVQVTGSEWLAQAGGLDSVELEAYGPQAEALLAMYAGLGGQREGSKVTFDIDHLEVHGTAMEGERQR